MKTKCCDLRYIGDNHDPITEGVCRNCGHCEKCEENKELKKQLDTINLELKTPSIAFGNKSLLEFIKTEPELLSYVTSVLVRSDKRMDTLDLVEHDLLLEKNKELKQAFDLVVEYIENVRTNVNPSPYTVHVAIAYITNKANAVLENETVKKFMEQG